MIMLMDYSPKNEKCFGKGYKIKFYGFVYASLRCKVLEEELTNCLVYTNIQSFFEKKVFSLKNSLPM